jgi:hypothetical protein
MYDEKGENAFIVKAGLSITLRKEGEREESQAKITFGIREE